MSTKKERHGHISTIGSLDERYPFASGELSSVFLYSTSVEQTSEARMPIPAETTEGEPTGFFGGFQISPDGGQCTLGKFLHVEVPFIVFGLGKEESEADPGRHDYLKVYVPGETAIRDVKIPRWALVRSLQYLAQNEGVGAAIGAGWADLEAMGRVYPVPFQAR
jgi:hypothetical protein